MSNLQQHQDTISQIHPLNYDHIRRTQPHRLYVSSENGKLLEFRTQAISSLAGEVRDRAGIILGITESLQDSEFTDIFFIKPTGDICRINRDGSLSTDRFQRTVFYMLLRPLERIDNWHLLDLQPMKQEKHSPWEELIFPDSQKQEGPQTYHPRLESIMNIARNKIDQRF